MIYINKNRFYAFIKTVCTIIAIILFCIFIWQHSGLTARTKSEPSEIIHEVQTYEIEYQTSRYNERIKEAVPVKVVYRYVTR